MDSIIERLKTMPRTRIIAFGSSNTERRIAGLHWFDWLELGLVQTHGRVHTCINTGLGGDTTRGLLERFDEDVARYDPHIVFVTIGGNDSKPDSGIDPAAFRTALLALTDRIRALDATPVFQTYYAADIPGLGPQHGARFLAFMDIVREVAVRTSADLVDHHRRWEPLRLRHNALYQTLMLDPLHVNALGNMVMGLDLIRTFSAQLDPATQAHCREGRWVQAMMDALGA